MGQFCPYSSQLNRMRIIGLCRKRSLFFLSTTARRGRAARAASLVASTKDLNGRADGLQKSKHLVYTLSLPVI
jgi:hypothetical protein